LSRLTVLDFYNILSNPRTCYGEKRELQKHLFLVIGANLTNVGITNLEVIVAG
jgi:hypothetical protein